MNNTELGSLGEQMACEYIRKKDFQIIERNYRFKKNEIDIIAQKDNQLIVIEVKTRQTAEIGEPWQAVTRNKQKQIIQVANQYIQTNNIELETWKEHSTRIGKSSLLVIFVHHIKLI